MGKFERGSSWRGCIRICSTGGAHGFKLKPHTLCSYACKGKAHTRNLESVTYIFLVGVEKPECKVTGL